MIQFTLEPSDIGRLLVDVSTPAGHDLAASLGAQGINPPQVVGNGQTFLRVCSAWDEAEEIRINAERFQERALAREPLQALT